MVAENAHAEEQEAAARRYKPGAQSVLLQLRDERLVKTFAAGKFDISDELVFPSEAGTPIEMNNFSERVFKPLLSRAGLGKIRFHDLRHSYGSLLIQAGASLAYVRDQMGHSSIQVTVDIDRKSTRLNSSHTVISYA